MSKVSHQSGLGPAHTYPDIFKTKGVLASNAAALFPSPRREGTRGRGNKAAALEAKGVFSPVFVKIRVHT